MHSYDNYLMVYHCKAICTYVPTLPALYLDTSVPRIGIINNGADYDLTAFQWPVWSHKLSMMI